MNEGYDYHPELAQALFGNPWLPYEGYWAENGLRWLLEVIHETYNIDYDVEPEFTSNIFDLRPYYWGDDDAEASLPNFRYKPDDIEVNWYKYLGRGMTSNRAEMPENWISVIQHCVETVAASVEGADGWA